jgi:hypothetical protein
MKSMMQQFKANRVDLLSQGDGTSSTQSITITADDLIRKGKNGVCYENQNTGLATYTLPPALAGYQVSFTHRVTGGTKIVPASGETLQGTTTNGAVLQGTANQYATNTVKGNRITLHCVVDGGWEILKVTGAWALT